MMLCIGGVSLCAGCSRPWWRKQADCEVRATVEEKLGYFDLGEIAPASDSRLADPFDPDCEPMPPDDPRSHELMHEVDGHRGWAHWHDNGDVPTVDAELWHNSLPRNANGEIVIDLPNSVRIARKHSREFQTELEDLYLSALNVTLQRFRFDTQFFAGNSITGTFDGETRSGSSDSSTLNLKHGAELQKLTATGGELVAGFANSLVWQFSGNDSDSFGSLLNFSLLQPLLRFGGRARVLERLTLSERRLLANARQMEQYRRGFYVQIVAGRNSGAGPDSGGNVGQSGLGVLAGLPSGRAGAAPVGGFLGVLQEQVQIRNRTNNLAALRDSVTQLDAFFEAGRLQTRLQVDQTRQAYYNAQSNLLTSKAGYASRLDSFKLNLGLPPTLPLKVEDPLINRFDLIDADLTALLDQVNDALDRLRTKSIPVEQIDLPKLRDQLLANEDRLQTQLTATQVDYDRLLEKWPQRAARLTQLREQAVSHGHDVDLRLFDAELIRSRVNVHAARLKANRTGCDAMLTAIRKISAKELQHTPEETRDLMLDLASKLSGEILDTMLTQASVRLEGIDLLNVSFDEPSAIETARANRLDWMNVRATLVDAWRQIEFEGNALDSGLNVRISGDLGTRGDNPAEFTTDNGRLKLGLEFDSPITRLDERNRYRAAQIEFQRARRGYMEFEDEVCQSVRNTLRIIDLSQINFEIRRAAVLVAISQVTLARLRLFEPPRVVVGNAPANPVSPTTARDLVSALNDLLDSQNDLLNAWVSYEVLRMLLDFELGTMQLNQEGLWIDPGAIEVRSGLSQE